jgi:hypothetical protein
LTIAPSFGFKNKPNSIRSRTIQAIIYF